MKKYIASTVISVSVALQKGGYARVSFSPLSDGSSVCYTADEEIQWALEHHYKYGKLFRLESTEEEESAPVKKTANKPTTKKGALKPSKKQTDEEAATTPEESREDSAESEESEYEPEEMAAELREVSVTDLDDAKDYLAEHYGVVRTKLKSEEMIKETALSYGITFKFD